MIMGSESPLRKNGECWDLVEVSKSILEKSKFERELKRLECSINYEGGKKQNVGGQVRGCQIMEFK